MRTNHNASGKPSLEGCVGLRYPLRWVLQATYPWVCGILTHRNTQYKPQKISFQALSSEILSPEYLSSGWIEELDPLTRQDWGHSRDEILIIYFEPFQFFFIQDGKHRYVEAQKFNKHQIFDAYIISSDCCVDAILNTEGKLLYRIFKDVQYYCQLCNI